jgi:hypothetical protein
MIGDKSGGWIIDELLFYYLKQNLPCFKAVKLPAGH